ncbi:unnamed protein product [Protopolystoma xenopodis]|uniref:Uncharacterized protein n=1 Tax=Protopolystoma xenopodis TaxID=117903 RepID=A0A3S5CPY8_9PLAT|nr:unnamed protein product [Protopolystoma xenopodis]
MIAVWHDPSARACIHEAHKFNLRDFGHHRSLLEDSNEIGFTNGSYKEEDEKYKRLLLENEQLKLRIEEVSYFYNFQTFDYMLT